MPARGARDQARRLQPNAWMLFRASLVLGALLAIGCGGATRHASPQSTPGTAALTGATMKARFDRVLVADQGLIAMVARDGCVAALAAGRDDTGEFEEMRVRCPKPERLKAWFTGVDRITAAVEVTPVDEDSEEPGVPAAELVTGKGAVMRVSKRADAERLLGEVRALSAELAAAEMPTPGPKSEHGWEMLRVSGPARVMLGGKPTAGNLEARMSTNGQYLCEFTASTRGGPVRATKSGWVSPNLAATAIDEVLSPFADVGSSERRPSTFASGTAGGGERIANPASTAAVFKRFAIVQDALGDACLPELDAPPAPPLGI